MSGEPEKPTSPESSPETLIGTTTPETASPKTEEGVKPEPPKTEPAASEPLTVESIKFPEGMEVDEPLRDEFLTVMNNPDLSPKDRAQALIDLQAKAMQAVSEKGNKLWSDMQDQWQKEARDKFGTALEPTLGNISTGRFHPDGRGKPSGYDPLS
jgi:hypothetical protein